MLLLLQAAAGEDGPGQAEGYQAWRGTGDEEPNETANFVGLPGRQVQRPMAQISIEGLRQCCTRSR